MNIYLDVQSPAVNEAGKAGQQLRLAEPWADEPAPRLLEPADAGAVRGEHLPLRRQPVAPGSAGGDTGKHTARAAADKFVVREQSTEDKIWWGQYNRPFTGENFSALLSRLQGYLQGRDVFVQDCYAGADPEYSLPIRIITQKAWHSLFARTMFLKIRNQDALKRHVPEFTVIAAPSFMASPHHRRHPHRNLHRAQFPRAHGHHRWHQLRRRNQEDDLHGPEFPVAARGRAFHALLGQRGRGRRCGHLFRPLGHRQDHPLRRSQSPPDRRRRARLERQRRVQLRRWLLRQGHPPLA